MKKILAIAFIVLVFILACLHASATDYYFSNSGSDAAAGTSAGTAWATIAKFNSSFAGFSPGDNIYFNRGDVFYGSLIISRSGSAGLPITIGAYGSGAKPIITGFTTVTAWTNLGSNIWESTSAVTALSECNMVVINGVNTPMGRYPNTGYLTYQSSTATTKTSTSIPVATTNWTGAQIVSRKHHWITDSDPITAHSGNTITHSVTPGPNTYAGIAGYGFFIQADIRTLDAQNEWYFNPSTKKLRIYSTSSPTGVQVPTIDTLVSMKKVNSLAAYITFDNIQFIGSNMMTFCINARPNVIIQNCSLDYAGYDAIWGGQNWGSPFSPNFQLINTTINHTNNNSVDLASEFTNALIQNCSFKNNGLIPGAGGDGDSKHMTVRTFAAGAIIEYNTFDSLGYVGIMHKGDNIIVRFNYIRHYNMMKMDGGGIYTWRGTQAENFGVKIYNNIIVDAAGSVAGTTQVAPLVHGIYLDENTQNEEVYNNTCANLGYGGLYIYPGSSSNNIHDNTFYNNGVHQMLFTNTNTSDPTINTILKNNIFFSRTATQYTARFSTSSSIGAWAPTMGILDSNYYARPIDDNLTMRTVENNVFTDRTLAQWKTLSGKDAASNKSPKTITTVNDLRFEYNATSSPVTVDLGAEYIDVRNVAYDGSITLQPYTSAVLIAAQTNYYFDATAGNDANAGTITAPYKTLTKLNSLWLSGVLNPGDSLFLKRGETFYGFISAGESGTAIAPINIAAYGTGAKPLVTGFTTISGWTNLGGGIWESAVTTALLPYLNMVTVDDVNTGMGRYPDTDAANGGFLKFESFGGTWNGASSSFITDAQLTGTPNWTGAEVVIKPAHWLLNRANITSHSGGTLNFVGDQQPLGNGYGYFIQNDPRTLTKFGEWYHNKVTEKISMYFGAELPSNHVIQAATIDSLVYISGKSYIHFYNINFQGANGTAFRTIGSGQTGIQIDSCTIQFAGIDGIDLFSNLSGFRLTNSNVWDCNDDGVNASQSTGAVITDNSIRNTYLIPGQGGEMDGHGWGIRVNTNALVEYNRIVNMGYVGIYLNGNNCIIRNNFIDSFNIHKDDAGAIYSASTGGYVAQTGRQILNNIILHGIGNLYGTPSTETSVYNIYMDDNVNGVLIQGNTSAYSTNSGLKLHNCRDITVRGNTFFDHDHDAFHVLDDNNHLETQGLRIASNIFALKYPTQWAMSLYDNLDNIGGFGTADSNVYAGLLGNNTSIINGRNNLAIYEYHDLPSWRLRYGEDANGAYSQKTVRPYRDLVLVGASKIQSPLNNSTMTNCCSGWSNASFVASGSGLDGGALQVTPNATATQSTAINVGSVTSGTPYVLRFSLKTGTYSNQGSFGVRLRNLTATQYHKIITTREEIEILFVPSVSSASTTLEFIVSEGGTTFYLDNIYFYQATATVTNPNDSIRFEYNDTKVNKVVSLGAESYKDVYGTTYSTSVTLTPYTSKVLIFNTGLTTPIVKINPTITWANPAAITHPAPLTGTQLNATSGGVPGQFIYTPASSTVLNAGSQSLNVEFIPDNETIYNRAFKTVTIVVNKGTATMVYSNLSRVYTGLPLAPTITTTPAGLTVINTLYNGVGSTPTNAGSYSLSSSLNNANYTATTITGTFTITKATVTITVTSNLNQTADGNPKPVQAVTNPAGKTLVITYNGSATVPSAPGTYTVDIAVNDPNYQGTLQVTLNIVTSTADIFITDILQTYDGTSKAVTVTSPYSYTLTYNPVTHVNAGSYQVIATINDGVHTGADTATFVIQKANPVLTWPTPERIFSGTALSSVQLNATSSIPGTFSYSRPLGTILPLGTQQITATFTPTDTVNYNTVTITNSISVFGDVLNYYITNGRTIYINN